MTDKEKRTKYEQYRKEHLKRVPLDMQKKDYERLKAHAFMAGVPVNKYIKESIKARMDKEDKKLGISEETLMRVNENGMLEYYRQFSTDS